MRTRRLLLRPLTLADAPRIALLAGDWDVARMTARVPHPYDAGSRTHYWIDDLGEGEVVWGIVHGHELVGLCGYLPGEDNAAEIGYWIGKPWWGRGYATEAARVLVNHCFGSLRLKRLSCAHFVDNPASARVIAKLGFRFTGRDKFWCEARGAEVATVCYERHRPLIYRAAKAISDLMESPCDSQIG